MSLAIKRLANQILENNVQMENAVIIGIQPRGIFLSDRIVAAIRTETQNVPFDYGKLDITFYRDDVRKELHLPNHSHSLPFAPIHSLTGGGYMCMMANHLH